MHCFVCHICVWSAAVFLRLKCHSHYLRSCWGNACSVWFNPLECFFGSEGHVALDRNPGPGYDTLLLRLIPGYLLSACPHRQFHTLPGLLDSRAALPNSYPYALRAREAVCTTFMMVYGMTRPTVIMTVDNNEHQRIDGVFRILS